MSRTVAQDAASVNTALDGIWRMGDRDECSIKHIGHATAAISSGKSWADGLDYSTPWAGDEDWIPLELERNNYPQGRPGVKEVDGWAVIPWTEARKKAKYTHLAKRWTTVQAKRDTWGPERFDQVMRATKFRTYYAAYISDWQNKARTGRAGS